MKQSLALRVGQTLTMTPALQQAIRLLQLSSIDLQQEIQQALESNVMLEVDEPEAEAPIEEVAIAEPQPHLDAPAAKEEKIEPAAEDVPVELDWDTDGSYETASGTSGRDAAEEEELHEFRQANLHSGETLREHLLWQARLAPFSSLEMQIAEYLIDAINDDGYLENFGEACANLGQAAGATTEDVERVLKAIQDFDPPGVGARDLTECLRLQLLQYPEDLEERAPALDIVNNHMLLLARHDEAALQQATGIEPELLKKSLALIQSLQPHPGRPYQAHEANYAAPDVIVTKKNGKWVVSLNAETAPRLRINPHYLSFVRRSDTSRDQQTLKTHLQEARYFISALESRNDTLIRVAQTIVEEQRAFLEYGEEAMRPLVLRDVAERLGVHESTVSRATANKYMLTPRGFYELKYFFSSHVHTTQGGTCSATAIHAMIKRLIGQEPQDKPLSDSTIADLLLKEGIQVARRTVAKYREAMGIPPSHERKPAIPSSTSST
jgi:RNA polymerase sigma-54 factor